MAGRAELTWAHSQSEEGLKPGFIQHVSAWSYQEAPHLIYLNSRIHTNLPTHP